MRAFSDRITRISSSVDRYTSSVIDRIVAVDWATIIGRIAVFTIVFVVGFAVVFSTASLFSLLISLLLRWRLVPKAEISQDSIYFDYALDDPEAFIYLLYPHKQWEYTKFACIKSRNHNCQVYKDTETLYLRNGIRYDFYADFYIPASARNYRIAVSSIRTQIFNIHGELIATSSRPLVLILKTINICYYSNY